MSDWPSMTALDAMPDHELKAWFWQPLAALTAEHRATLRSVAERLYQPPPLAPVYHFIEPVAAPAEEPEKPAPKPVKKAKLVEPPKAEPEPKPEAPPEQSSLSIFKELFRS